MEQLAKKSEYIFSGDDRLYAISLNKKDNKEKIMSIGIDNLLPSKSTLLSVYDKYYGCKIPLVPTLLLTQTQVKQLLPILQKFAEEGEI